MKYVRVRNQVGHEFSTPESDPLIGKGVLERVDRKAPTNLPTPPKLNPFPKNSKPPAGGETLKEGE